MAFSGRLFLPLIAAGALHALLILYTPPHLPNTNGEPVDAEEETAQGTFLLQTKFAVQTNALGKADRTHSAAASGHSMKKIVDEHASINISKDLKHAYFINLDSKTSRRQHMESQFFRTGFNAQRLRAVDSTRVALGEFNQDLSAQGLDPFFSQLTEQGRSSSIACYLSHLQALMEAEKVLHGQDEVALIVEDDVLIPDGWQAELQKIVDQAPQDWALLKLSSAGEARVSDLANADLNTYTLSLKKTSDFNFYHVRGPFNEGDPRDNTFKLFYKGSGAYLVRGSSIQEIIHYLRSQTIKDYDVMLLSDGSTHFYESRPHVFNPSYDAASGSIEHTTKWESDFKASLAGAGPPGAPRPVPVMDSQSSSTCGSPLQSECPLDYSIHGVELLASKSQSEKDADSQALQQVHGQARQACSASGTIAATGGWCYSLQGSQAVIAAGGKTDIDYILPLHHVRADEIMVSVLAKHVLPREDGSISSVTDFGAGVGQFGHALRAQLPELEYHGYDGGGNVEEFTNGYVNFADLTLPLSLKRTDWVFSSEVGEHIPHEHEAQVIANIHAHNCRGVILTWAVVGQDGVAHVNCHSSEYLVNIFEGLGYKLNEELTAALRTKRNPGEAVWLEHSSLAFDRVSKPAECA
jgi:GR25 family glycosyltransferase involved in LPS biosynthesis